MKGSNYVLHNEVRVSVWGDDTIAGACLLGGDYYRNGEVRFVLSGGQLTYSTMSKGLNWWWMLFLAEYARRMNNQLQAYLKTVPKLGAFEALDKFFFEKSVSFPKKTS